MNTRNIAFYVFYAGICLLALYVVSRVSDVTTSIFYFGCGIAFSISALGIYACMNDLKEGRRK